MATPCDVRQLPSEDMGADMTWGSYAPRPASSPPAWRPSARPSSERPSTVPATCGGSRKCSEGLQDAPTAAGGCHAATPVDAIGDTAGWKETSAAARSVDDAMNFWVGVAAPSQRSHPPRPARESHRSSKRVSLEHVITARATDMLPYGQTEPALPKSSRERARQRRQLPAMPHASPRARASPRRLQPGDVDGGCYAPAPAAPSSSCGRVPLVREEEGSGLAPHWLFTTDARGSARARGLPEEKLAHRIDALCRAVGHYGG